MTTSYKPSGRQIQKSKVSGAIGEHPTDAIGYLIFTFDYDCGLQPLTWMG